ncbi:MAG: TolC family protein, partial [Rhodospirillales bacterium]|nr:TolC family protein [Rhodospirillales bacterium]
PNSVAGCRRSSVVEIHSTRRICRRVTGSRRMRRAAPDPEVGFFAVDYYSVYAEIISPCEASWTCARELPRAAGPGAVLPAARCRLRRAGEDGQDADCPKRGCGPIGGPDAGPGQAGNLMRTDFVLRTDPSSSCKGISRFTNGKFQSLRLPIMRSSRLFRAGAIGLALLLGGCATYQALPLAKSANLKASLEQLDLTVPSGGPNKGPTKIDPGKPLSADEVGLIAVLNSPSLAAQSGQLSAARAGLLAATILPNPSLSVDYEFYLGGPGTSNSLAASVSQDVRSIVTYSPRVQAAKARLGQVKANLLWQDWLVAQRARLLAVDIYADERRLKIRGKELSLLDGEVNQVRAAIAAGNLTLSAEAPLLAAKARAETAIATIRMTLITDWQNLDALIGLDPSAHFAIAAPAPVSLPDNVNSLIETLPKRRPDLVALRLGYQASDQDVREAILGQFPAFAIGPAGGWDTSRVYSMGPIITMSLPIFNRNQAEIASARATRAQLHADYQARLDDAVGTSKAIIARIRTIQSDLREARSAAGEAGSLAASALQAFEEGNLDERALTDYQTTALERRLDVLNYQRALDETTLALSIELGTGFPETMLVSSDKVKQP